MEQDEFNRCVRRGKPVTELVARHRKHLEPTLLALRAALLTPANINPVRSAPVMRATVTGADSWPSKADRCISFEASKKHIIDGMAEGIAQGRRDAKVAALRV